MASVPALADDDTACRCQRIGECQCIAAAGAFFEQVRQQTRHSRLIFRVSRSATADHGVEGDQGYIVTLHQQQHRTVVELHSFE